MVGTCGDERNEDDVGIHPYTDRKERKMNTTRRMLGAVMLGTVIGVMSAADVQAKRLGGGTSSGVQRSVSAPSKPASAPAQSSAAQSSSAQAPAAANAAGTGSRWLPLLGGLAAGGLLGALFGGSGAGALVLLALLLLIGGAIAFAFMRHRAQGRTAGGLGYAGAQAGGGYGTLGVETTVPPLPQGATQIPAQGATGRSETKVPADFDVQGFLRAAKMNFIKLQVANDKGDLEEIRDTTTPEMFEILRKPILERRGAAQQTDVVSLNADLLEVVTEADRHYASVRFSGMVWEIAGSAPQGFEEIWNLVKPADGSSGWLLAGIQQAH